MNYKMLGIIFSFFVLFAVGCTKNNDNSGDPDDILVHSNHEDEVVGSNTSQSTAPEVGSELKLEGDIENIYYADKDKVLIAADKLYLYDIGTEDILQESPQETFESEKFWKVDSGYVAVRQIVTSDHGETMMIDGEFDFSIIFYDYDLNIVSEFDLNQLFEEEDFLFSLDAISFSSTGNEIAYATYSGLYMYDFEKEAKMTVIDLASEDAKGRGGIVNIEQIGFTNEDQRIAFKAQSFDVPVDPNKDSFDTCGIVNTDGSQLLNQTFDNFKCKELTAYNHLVVFAEDPIVASGRTLVMETPSNQTKIHTLTEKAESGHISGSNAGRYFATSVSNKDGLKIRVYDTETGELKSEQQIPIDEDYTAQLPIIKVIDEMKTVIVLVGSKRDDIETKMIVSEF